MASTTASSVSTLMEKSSRYITKKIPTSDTGMATTGISVERQSRKNRKMIITTSTKASMMVCSTSVMDLRINTELSKPGLSTRSLGRVLAVEGNALVELVGNVNLVGARLRNHRQAHHGHAVHLEDGLVVFGVELGVADVGEAHQRRGVLADNQVVEVRHRAQAAHGAQGELGVLALHRAAGQLHVFAGQGGLHVHGAHAQGRELHGVHPQAHGVLPLPVHPHLRHAPE